MITEFRQWLKLVVSPERYEILTGTLDLLISINGTEFQEIETTLWSLIGMEDTFMILDRLNSECLVWSLSTAQRFGVTFNDATATLDEQSLINEVLTALTTLDAYELPQELLDIIEDSQHVTDTFSSLVSVVTMRDMGEYLPLLSSVSPALIDAIKTAAMETRDLQEEFDLEVGTEKELVVKFKEVVGKIILADDDPVKHYLLHTGKLGLNLEAYVSLLGEHLTVEDNMDVLAARWMLLAYASTEGLQQTSKLFELVYQDIRKIMRLNASYKRLGDSLND